MFLQIKIQSMNICKCGNVSVEVYHCVKMAKTLGEMNFRREDKLMHDINLPV